MAFLKQLYNGTSTIDFSAVWNSSKSPGYYLIDNTWTPTIPSRRSGVMGGRQLYEYQQETFQFAIVGSDDDDVYAKLHNLTAMFDQARRWWDSGGRGVSPVLYKIRPHGSTRTNPLQAAVWETTKYKAQISLPPHIEDIEGNAHLTPISLTFTHRVLLGDEESANSGTAVIQPAVMTATFANAVTIPAPCDMKITAAMILTMGSAIPDNIYCLFTSITDGILVVDAATMASGDYTSFPDSKANGGTVLRYTPIGTSASSTGAKSVSSSISQSARRFYFYANMRSNIADVTWTINIRAEQSTTTGVFYDLDTNLVIDGSEILNPFWNRIGEISVRDGLSRIEFEITASTITGSPTLDIDDLVILAVDETSADILRHDSSLNTTTSIDFQHSHNSLTYPFSSASISSGTDKYYPGNEGNSYIIMSGSTVNAILLAASNSASAFPDRWQWINSYLSKATGVLTVTRRPAYLVPQ